MARIKKTTNYKNKVRSMKESKRVKQNFKAKRCKHFAH